MNEKFKVRFNFISLVSIGALIGFCAGVVSIPLYLFNIMNSDVGALGAIWLVPIAPIGGLINGALLGILAYPLYWWLSKKVGFTFKGQIFVIK